MTRQPMNSIEAIIADPDLKNQLKELVLERMNALPDSMHLAVGSSDFSKAELMENIREESEVGKQVMEMELEFLRDLASGAVYNNE